MQQRRHRDQPSSAEGALHVGRHIAVTMLCSSTAAAVDVMNSWMLPIADLIAHEWHP
jgi:hypothetical protein